jgi:undecaprenyl-diphosphatase
MSLLQAIILGIVQGATEFIPVSSTAHMIFALRALGLEGKITPQQVTATMAVVQLGTLAAVLLYFSRELVSMVGGLLSGRDAEGGRMRDRRMVGYMVIGTIPVAVVGLALKPIIEGALTKNLAVIGGSLVGVALLLLAAELLGTRRRGEADLKWTDALFIGLMQVLALVPGSSRSGTTLAAALFLGLQRETGARFSFLLSIPAVAASGLLELVTVRAGLAGVGWGPVIVATLVAAVVGFASIEFLLRYLRRHSTAAFIAYRIAVGVAVLALIAVGVLGSATRS